MSYARLMTRIWRTVEGEGLLARAICHEIDHLDGKLYKDLVEDGLHEVTQN